MKSLKFAAILVSVCAVAACSDDGGGGGSGGEGGAGGGPGGTTTTSASSTVTTGTGTGGGNEGGGGNGGGGSGSECADLAEDACFECCSAEHEEGDAELSRLVVESCACGEGATCNDVCDTEDAATDACADDGTINPEAEPTEACVNCLNGVLGGGAEPDACLTDVVDGCAANTDCRALLTCGQGCGE
ncbi:hypothetical protein [Sorangium sp. So ce131]|uniref:hypothetical protein n=1 Tax=Sorangium sp. So ce131 TaxID=3133282 RepID=UPI003F6486A5